MLFSRLYAQVYVQLEQIDLLVCTTVECHMHRNRTVFLPDVFILISPTTGPAQGHKDTDTIG